MPNALDQRDDLSNERVRHWKQLMTPCIDLIRYSECIMCIMMYTEYKTPHKTVIWVLPDE